MAKKGRKDSRRQATVPKWTGLEMALAVIVVILVIVAVYAFTVREEIVEVGTIETYAGAVDLRVGDGDNSSYTFTRELKVDYQVQVIYKVPHAGTGAQPTVHFKVWNETTGETLFKETTQAEFTKNIRLDAEDAGTYEFIWWVEEGSGSSRVDFDVLIQPTERLFEKRT